MTQREGEKEGYKSTMAKKVPPDIAGPVLIAIIFIATSPFILERLHTETQVFCYLAFLGIIAFCVVFPISLHSISKYRERETNSLLRSLREFSPRQNINPIIEKEIEEAVTSMEEGQDEGKEE